MIVVFVSKDDEEFNRYKNGCVKHVIKQLTYSPMSRENVSNGGVQNDTASSNALSASFESLKQEYPEEARGACSLKHEKPSCHDESKSIEYMIIPDSIVEYYDSGTFVVVIRSGDYIRKLKKSIRPAYAGLSVENLLAIVGKVINDALPAGGQIVGEHDVSLLIHWGRVNDLAAEELKFNNTISAFDYKKCIGCKSLAFHALSSRRPSFNVQRAAIRVPVGKEEVDELLQRFKSERAVADVKDIMTNYLRKPNTEMDDLEKFMASREFRKKVREAAMEPKFKWLLEWRLLRDFIKATSEKKIGNTVNEDQEKTLISRLLKDDQEKSLALISQLLSEGLV